MSDLSSMIWVETRKALRSAVPWFTGGAALVMPLAIAFLIWLATNPDIAGLLGLVGAKANLVAYASTDWPAYMGLAGQMVAAGGFIISVLVVTWVFGREFSDRTVKDLLAVPVRRWTILLAKFIVTAVWSAALSLLTLIVTLLVGLLLDLPDGSPGAVQQGSLLVAITALLTVLVVLPIAFFASVGRGYLLPFGAAILVLILANIAVVLGLGAFFPWAIPGLYSQGGIPPASYFIVGLTALGGMAATYLWWKNADQSR